MRTGTSVLLLGSLFLPSTFATADIVTFYDPMDGTFALQAASPGLVEPPVPIFHNGTLIGGHNHQVVEIYDRVPGTNSFPLTVVDLAANMFLRTTYQNADGTTAPLGTSILGSPSYRTASGLQFVPTVDQANVTTGIAERYKNEIAAHFGTDATVSSTRTLPNDPVLGRTDVGLSVHFEALQDIPLATGAPFVNNDRLRLLTVSSMFSSDTVFDANIIRYEDINGNIQTKMLDNSTARGTHLLSAADEVGSWIEVIKGPGSTWFPTSPTMHIDILDKGGLNLGIQGFLANTLDPNDDSLSLWFEVLGAPDTIATGTSFDVSFRVSAVPEPSTFVLATLSAFFITGSRRVSKRSQQRRRCNCEFT